MKSNLIKVDFRQDRKRKVGRPKLYHNGALDNVIDHPEKVIGNLLNGGLFSRAAERLICDATEEGRIDYEYFITLITFARSIGFGRSEFHLVRTDLKRRTVRHE